MITDGPHPSRTDPNHPNAQLNRSSTDYAIALHVCVSGNDPDSPLVGVPVTLTVTDQTCDRTVTGNHSEPVFVSGGLTCLAHGSAVSAPVTVAAGASLFVWGFTVDEPVLAEGAVRVELSWSTVVGPVSCMRAPQRCRWSVTT
jgi:hypothetical protein